MDENNYSNRLAVLTNEVTDTERSFKDVIKKNGDVYSLQTQYELTMEHLKEYLDLFKCYLAVNVLKTGSLSHESTDSWEQCIENYYLTACKKKACRAV